MSKLYQKVLYCQSLLFLYPRIKNSSLGLFLYANAIYLILSQLIAIFITHNLGNS